MPCSLVVELPKLELSNVTLAPTIGSPVYESVTTPESVVVLACCRTTLSSTVDE